MLDPCAYFVIAGKSAIAQVRMLHYSLSEVMAEDIDVHEVVHEMGYRGVEIVYRRMVSTDDWLLRCDSVYDAYAPLTVTRTYEGAQAAARAWVMKDPEKRYAFTRATTLGDALGALVDPALE